MFPLEERAENGTRTRDPDLGKVVRETHAPETCASTNSATWASEGKNLLNGVFRMLSGKRDSDPRPQPWQGCALPTELFPQLSFVRNISLNAVAKVRLFF